MREAEANRGWCEKLRLWERSSYQRGGNCVRGNGAVIREVEVSVVYPNPDSL
jgi:hypothetical protein